MNHTRLYHTSANLLIKNDYKGIFWEHTEQKMW